MGKGVKGCTLFPENSSSLKNGLKVICWSYFHMSPLLLLLNLVLEQVVRQIRDTGYWFGSGGGGRLPLLGYISDLSLVEINKQSIVCDF